MESTIKKSTIKNILEKLKDKKLSPTNFSSDNVLYLLGIHYNEVVICRLIKAIIEPNGFHGLGNKPFELFMQNVIGVGEFEIGNGRTEIVLEEQIDNNRRIDIAIYYTNNDEVNAQVFVYPIEVKIWAKDQDRQLYDYYNYYKHKPDKTKIKKIYYLTPDGHDPSDLSIGELDKEKIRKLSFKEDIREYLVAVLQQTKNDDCKSIINNFIEVIDVMNADEKNIKEFKEIFDELENNNDKKMIFSLLRNADKKWENCRDEFLKQSIRQYLEQKYNKFQVVENSSEFEKIDSHCIFFVKYDGKEAFICIDTNLYIAMKKEENKEWKKYDDTGYCWRYVCAKDSNKTKWNLKTIDEELFNKTIDWEKYL